MPLTGSASGIVYAALPIDDPKVRRPDITRATGAARLGADGAAGRGAREGRGVREEQPLVLPDRAVVDVVQAPPTVSIVTATYNRAGILPRADRQRAAADLSGLGADRRRRRIDGRRPARSWPATPTSASGSVAHERNRGATAAKNTGFDHMRGEWFTILDSDDEMVPDALEVMLDCAQRTGANAITCNCVDSQTGEMTGLGHTGDGRIVAARSRPSYRGEHWGLTQTSLLGDLRFDERLPTYEDTVWLKINAQGSPLLRPPGASRLSHRGERQRPPEARREQPGEEGEDLLGDRRGPRVSSAAQARRTRRATDT